MTAPPMKYADAPGMERSAAEIRPPAEDSATARVSLRATRRAATDAEREESFSGIVLGTSLGSEPAYCASGAERVSNRRTFRVVDLLRMTKQDGGNKPMGQNLEQFAAECRRILKDTPGPDGREKVRALVEEILKDDAFVAKHLTDDVPERKILYEDPDLGFCILAHVYNGGRESQPHDHGPSWAIYGQARGETIMNDWQMVTAAQPDTPGKVRHVRSYTLKPGMAHVYNEGDLHSPRREGPTRLIRIEGTNMDRVKRLAYERV